MNIALVVRGTQCSHRMKEETKSNKEKKIIQRSNFLQIANKSLLIMLGETDISWTQFHKFHVSSAWCLVFSCKMEPYP